MVSDPYDTALLEPVFLESMIKQLLIISLMLMFALQTITSVYDSHESHQSGDTHLAFDADHPDHHATDAEQHLNSAGDAEVDYDCHHCCHCHGSSSVYASQDTSPAFKNLKSSQSLNLSPRFSNLSISPDLRPPIA